MSTDENKKWLPVLVIAATMVLWGVVLATGAYFAPTGESGGQDGRKLLVVAATTGGFLLVWAGVLAISAAKRRRRQLQKFPQGAAQDQAAKR